MSSPNGRPREGTANIFINYRREDSAGHAGRLFDGLSRHFAGRLFMDVDTIEFGVDFVEAIERAVGSCEVLIVMIGREWLTIEDKAGHRRLDNPDDFVRLEIESALTRKIRVIPVLVQDAVMPRADELPPSLAKLARRNAIELSDTRWSYDVDRLAETVQEILEENGEVVPHLEAAPPPPAAPSTARPRAWLLAAAALVLVAAVVLGAAGWMRQTASGEKEANPQPAAGGTGLVPPPVSPVIAGPAGAPAGNPAADVTGAPEPFKKPAPEPQAEKPAGHPPATNPTTEPQPTTAVPIASPQPVQVTIASPRSGEIVGASVQVQGVVSGLGDQHVFLGIRQKNGSIYPRGRFFPEANGQWSIQLRSSKEKTFDILVVTSSNEEADRMLLDQRSRDNGLAILPTGAAIRSEIVTVKRQGKFSGIFNPKD